jgi:arylsulfatase A-like enzyme
MNRPNILIAIGDDISFPHMGAYGCTWVKTPGFDRVARDGILFRNAYTPNAKSSPSRACLLTGRNSWQLDEAANHVPFFPARFTTFIESLGDHGYTAGYTAKGWAPGTALDSAGNPRELTGRAFNVKKPSRLFRELQIPTMPPILKNFLIQRSRETFLFLVRFT